MVNVSPDWIKERFLDHFRDAMAAQMDDSEFDFEGHLFVSGLQYVAGALSEVKPDRDLTIRGIISNVLTDSIEFREDEFDAWSGNAYEFSSVNHNHPSFVIIFSDSKNYDVVLKDIMEIGYTYNDLRFAIKTEMKVSVKPSLFSDNLSDEVIGEIFSLGDDAIRAALAKVAFDIRDNGLEQQIISRRNIPAADKIERAPSYRNMKGAILFKASKERLIIDRNMEGLKNNPYTSIIKRATDVLLELNVIQRIGNKDQLIVRYLREYLEIFIRPESQDRALLLFNIGMDVESRLTYNQTKAPDDERLDVDLAQLISSFVVANGIYVQNYSAVGEMAEHIERNRILIKQLSHHELTTPGDLLAHLAERRNQIYDEKTGDLIERIAASVQDTQNPTTGLVALEIGTLRGSFREMANQILSFIYKNITSEISKFASDTIRTKIRELIQIATSKPSLAAAALAYITTYQKELILLADSLPSYFSWLRYLIEMVVKI